MADDEPVRMPQPLKVIIVGAGLAGFSAAIALRQQGHDVQIYESSGFSKELGAALNTAPNANGILKRLGVSCKDIGACVAEWMAEWTSQGEMVRKLDQTAFAKPYEHKWRLAHRIQLHEALRRVALQEEGDGPPAKLHLSMPVSDVDAANAIVHFKDGTAVQGDVVIGADGVHSVTRKKLPPGDIQPFPTGQSAFRFLVPIDAIRADARTQKFVDSNGQFNGIFSPDRNIVTYPTSNNTILNFVCFHPDTESVSNESWGSTASRSQLLDVFRNFHPDILALLEKADEKSLKVWKLLDMAQLPFWYHERLAVIGDAAHPFLPFLGQGAAIAIEDAVAIGVVLEKGLDRGEVPARLKLYQDFRKQRAELVQHNTRVSGRDRGRKGAFDTARFLATCFGHDEWDHSTQKLREWKWARDAQPWPLTTTIFGPPSSIAYTQRGRARSDAGPTFTAASIKFNTSRTVLDGMLPPGNRSLEFRTPASIAQCTIKHTSFHGLPSLGGRGYDVLAFYIHGVTYKDSDGKVVNGAFVPILFANMADIIVSKGAELGATMLWSTIDVERSPQSHRIRTRWEGSTWGNFYLDGLQPVDASQTESVSNSLPDSSLTDEGVILHQYVSQSVPGTSDYSSRSERVTFIPIKKGPNTSDAEGEYGGLVSVHQASRGITNKTTARVSRVWRANSAGFVLNAGDWDTLPTLHHIIKRLQDVRLISVVEATVVEGSGIPEL